jgi:exodeoxyribonuclease VII large subunit
MAEQLGSLESALLRAMQVKLETSRDRWSRLLKRLTDPGRKLRQNQQRLDELSLDLVRCTQHRLDRLREQLANAAGRLHTLSPLAVLDRGYSIAHKLPEGTIIKDAASLNVGDQVRITFAKGKSLCKVEEAE